MVGFELEARQINVRGMRHRAVGHTSRFRARTKPRGRHDEGARAQSRVAGMMEAIAHRGPDDSGLASSDTAVLGATRLAIRGLASGQQPIIHSQSGVVAVCNGEIDNHRELRRWLTERGHTIQSETDVAIIPELYLELGEKFVE